MSDEADDWAGHVGCVRLCSVPMENELKSHLNSLLNGFVLATGRSPSTVAQAATGDWRFFDRIQGGTFTLRKYDAIVAWFSENWPTAVEWPKAVGRPPSRKVGRAA